MHYKISIFIVHILDVKSKSKLKDMENKTNGLSIGGLVVGIIALLLSFVPCIGMFGGILALVGLILSFIGFRSAKDAGGPTTMAIIGMVLSGLAIIIAVAWGAFIAKAGSDMAEPLNLETCDEVLVEMEKAVKQVNAISEKGDDTGIGDISTIMNATTRIAKIKATAGKMDCNQDPEFEAKMDALTNTMD